MIKKLFLAVCLAFSFSGFSQSLAAGGYHSLMICSDNSVKDWGDNFEGELGINSTSSLNIPVKVKGPLAVGFLSGIIRIAGGSEFSMGLKNDGTVWTWGQNSSGQLGNGTTTTIGSYVPVQVSLLTNVTAIVAQIQNSVVIKSDSTVWVWGSNSQGEFGNGTYTSSNVPVKIPALSGVIAIGGGGQHSLGIKNNGTLWSWGVNLFGELGNGTTVDSNVPVQVSGLSGVTAVTGGRYYSIALKNDGTVWTFGNNANGQLGNGNNNNSSIPVQVSGLTGIVVIAGGYDHCVALKSDGTVWTWGRNQYGALGNGTVVDSNVPVQVSALTGVTAIAAGFGHSLGLKNDGTLHAWGYNVLGQLGDFTNTNSNVPVQLNVGMCSVLSVYQYKEQVNISVFPNPSNGKFQVSIANSQIESVQIKVTDVLGKEVHTEKIANVMDNFILDLSHLQNGIYFLQGNNTSTQKLIIQK